MNRPPLVYWKRTARCEKWSFCKAATFLVFSAFAPRAEASLLLYESFNFGGTGKNMVNAATNGGTGVSGYYTQIGSYSPYYSPSGLSMAGIPVTGGRLETGNAGTYLKTSVGASLAPTFPNVSGSVYMSYLFLINGSVSAIQPVSVSLNEGIGGAPAVALHAAGSDGKTAVTYGSAASTGGQALSANTTYLMLARFTNIGTNLTATAPGVATAWVLTRDQLAFFQTNGGPSDQALDSAPIGSSPRSVTSRISATLSSGRIDLNSSKALQVSIASSGVDIYDRVDEIRVGTSCADVANQIAPSNPNLMPAAAKVLHYLNAISGRYVVAGQFEEENSATAAGTDRNSNIIYQITGKRPALVGMDIGDNLPDPLDNAERLWGKGTIITLNWHMAPPINPSLVDGPNNAKTVVSANFINNVLTPGTVEYGNFILKLDKAAARLLALQQAGIPVLWRPLHECNGGWFWWSAGYGPGYIRLYRFMWNYFTNVKHLNNLIWVWGGANTVSASYYPGDAYVDIGGPSCYGASPDFTATWLSQFKTTQNVSHRSSCVLTECDLLPNPDLLFSSGANWSYWLDWNSNWLDQNIGAGIVRDPAHTNSIYQNAKTIDLDRIPDWSVYQSPLANRTAFSTLQAESFNASSGVTLESCSDSDWSGLDVGPVVNGQYLTFANVDFGSSGTTIWCWARIASATAGGTIEVHLDSLASPWTMRMTFGGTGGAQTWETVGWHFAGVTGVHNVYFVFKGGSGPLFSLNWLQFQ